MLVPIDWLKDYVEFNLTTPQLAELFTMAGLEVEAVEEGAHGAVLDVKVTPNRGDCLSIVGLAREVIARLGDDCKPTPLWQAFLGGFGAFDDPAGSQATEQWTSVVIEDPELGPRYAARIVPAFKVGPSPANCQSRLEAAGMRGINNIVDITNYVMLELGQPLHAFDYDTLAENRIVVRQAKSGESITTLDGKEHDVEPPMLMICDAERPVAVAGVMGGGPTEVTEKTTRLLLESAHFHPLSVRRTKRLLGFGTESAYRFERFVDPNLVVVASYRACQLLKEWCGIDAVPGVIDIYPKPAQPRQITLRMDRADKLLGVAVEPELAAVYLNRLGFDVERNGRVLNVTIPTFRYDLHREDDLVEEVGRVHGYDKIPERLPAGATLQGKISPTEDFSDRVRVSLMRSGLVEMVNHSLRGPSPLDPPSREIVHLRNPMSPEVSLLRPSLLAGLVESTLRNLRRGNPDVAAFEIGHVFAKTADGYDEQLGLAFVLTGSAQPAHFEMGRKIREMDFFDAKGVTEQMLIALGVRDCEFKSSNDPRLHPGRSAAVLAHDTHIGVIGEIHPTLQAEIDLPKKALVGEFDYPTLMRLASFTHEYKLLPRYPAVRRDIAFLIDRSVPWAVIDYKIHEAGGGLLEDVRLFDIYVGEHVPEGKQSLAVALTMRKKDGTLTEEEIGLVTNAVLTRLTDELGASQRQ